MKIVRFLTALLLAVFFSNAIAVGVDMPNLAYFLTPVITASSYLPIVQSALMFGYSLVDVNKSTESSPAYKAPKDKITVFRIEDVATYPSRDDKGIKITDNISLSAGASMITLYFTKNTLEYEGNSEGDIDAKAVKQLLNGSYPGYSLEVAEFAANNLNKGLGALVEFCDGSTSLLFGTECAPLQFNVETKGSGESLTTAFKFESVIKGAPIAHYFGTLTYASAFSMSADDTTPSIANGSGRYELSVNTVATVITTFDDAVAGMIVTLVGTNDTNASTITDGSTFVLNGGTTWTALDGAEITFEVFDDSRFIERSRK